jgi:transcriptional regulator with XRE-family HTH domain
MTMVLQDENLGKTIKRLRKKHHLSQQGLAGKLQLMGSSISRNTLSKIETGVRNVKVSDLILLSVALGVDLNTLFADVIPDKYKKHFHVSAHLD